MEKFHDLLKRKIHAYVVFSYKIANKLPKDEIYGLISQLKRASVSIMLNYVEGFARRKEKVKLNFYETSHGSTQECKYILYFSFTQKWIVEDEFKQGLEMLDEIAKMLWSTIDYLEQKIESI